MIQHGLERKEHEGSHIVP